MFAPEENELVAAAVAGDRDALAALLERHGPAVEARLRISPQWQPVLETADVMQVTYVEAFLHIGRFDPGRAAAFPAWLSRMAENNLRDAIRGLEAQKQPQPSRRVVAPPGDDSHIDVLATLTAGCGTPSRALRGDEARRLVESALEQLPPDYAHTIRMYDIGGRDIADVARALGRSPGAVHMLRSRALERLREALGGDSAIVDVGG